MALLEQALYSRLTTYAGLSALTGTRVYPFILPQNVTLPALTFRTVSARRFSAMAVDIGDVEVRVQIDVWSDKARDVARGVKDVAQQVRLAMRRWQGLVAGVVVLDTYFMSELDLFEPDVDATHRVMLDFRTFYEEA